MDERARYHEERSREIADKQRNSLLVLNTSGIGAILLVASSLIGIEHPLSMPRLLFPVGCFAVGVIFTHVSFFVAKSREIQRGDAAERGEGTPTWRWYHPMASTLYEILSSIMFILGAIISAIVLSSIPYPSDE
jgi:hypothetical protein